MRTFDLHLVELQGMGKVAECKFEVSNGLGGRSGCKYIQEGKRGR